VSEFHKREAARAVSTYSPFFEGEAKFVKRDALVHLFKRCQSQSGRPQRPESVTI
jgi:hypothetical protein